MTHNKPTSISAAILEDALEHIDINDMGAGLKIGYVASEHFDLAEGEFDFRIIASADRDDFAQFNDQDCYGKIEWIDNRGNWSVHPRPRPRGFDGAARKLYTWGNADQFWWQPWDNSEWAAMDRNEQAKFLALVQDLVTYGFSVLTVEVEYTCPCCGKWVELCSSSLGGIDSLKDYHGILSEVLHAALFDISLEVTE